MRVDHRYRSKIHATRKTIATGRSPGFMAEVMGAGTPWKCIGTVEANILGHDDVVVNRQCGHHGQTRRWSAQDTAEGDEANLRQDFGLLEARFVVQEVKSER